MLHGFLTPPSFSGRGVGGGAGRKHGWVLFSIRTGLATSSLQLQFQIIILGSMLPVGVGGGGSVSNVSSKQTNKNFDLNRNKICFGCVLVCFVKSKTKIFGLFRCFELISKQTDCFETNRNNPKFSEKYQICSLSNCFGWSSVCFSSIETSKHSVSV